MLRIRTARLALAFLLISGVQSQSEESSPSPEEKELRAVQDSNTPKHQGDEIFLSLKGAVLTALSNNLDIFIERVDVSLANTEIGIAEGALDPRLNTGFTYGERSSPRLAEQVASSGLSSVESRNTTIEAGISGRSAIGTELGFNTTMRNNQDTFNSFDDEWRTFIGFTLTQPLLRNFGTEPNLSDIRIARKGVTRADATLQFEIEEIVQQVYNAYFDLLFAEADYQSRLNALILARQLQKDNEARRELGAMTVLDVSQARSEVASRQSDLAQARRRVRITANRLKRLISRDFNEVQGRPLVLTDMFAEPKEELPEIPNMALGLFNRSDYKALQIQAEQNDLSLRFRKNQLLPTLDLTGSLGFSGLDSSLGRSYGNTFEATDEDWSIGFIFRYPLGNVTEKNRNEASQLRKERTLLELKRLEQDILLQVSDALARVESAREQIKAARLARLFSEEIAEAENEKLKEGASTSYTVLQLQRDVVNARTDELRALADYHIAMIELRAAQGLLLNNVGLEVEEPAVTPIRRAHPLSEQPAPEEKSPE